MKHFFIINPQSRHGQGRKSGQQLLGLLQNSGLTYEYAITESLDHAGDLSRQANRAGCDAITAVGGDGTINQVLNGFFDERGHRISHTAMGVIHTGTSPDFCKSHGIPTGLEDALQTISRGRRIPITVGQISFTSAGPQAAAPSISRTRFFGCCANIGLGASLARTANSGIRKYCGDTAGTFLSLMKVLCRYRPATMVMDVDNQQRSVLKVYNIAVGLTRYIASGIQVSHALKPTDARLYVMTVKALSVVNIVQVISTLYSGKPITNNRSALSLVYGARIAISSVTPTEVEFDGDPGGNLPCVISTAADPLDLIVERT